MSPFATRYPLVRGTWHSGFPGARPFHGRGVSLAGPRPARLAQLPAAAPGDPVGQLIETGAVVQVLLDVPADYKSAGGKSTPQTVRAMIDTGASISAVNNSVAQAVGLQAVGSTKLGGVGGVTESPIFAASMTLPDYKITVDPIQIAGVANPLPNVEMLIGRDLLSKNVLLTYKGAEGLFGLAQVAAGAPAPPGTAPSGPLTAGYKGGAPAPAGAQPGAPAPAGGPPPPSGQLPQPPPGAEGTSTGTYLLVGGGAAAALAAAGFIFKVF